MTYEPKYLTWLRRSDTTHKNTERERKREGMRERERERERERDRTLIFLHPMTHFDEYSNTFQKNQLILSMMYHRYFRFIQTLYKGVEKREENDAGKGWGWVVENDTISVVFTYLEVSFHFSCFSLQRALEKGLSGKAGGQTKLY